MEGWPGHYVTETGHPAYMCPEPHCYFSVGTKRTKDVTHNCPHMGTTSYGWSITVTLVEQIWGYLDEAFDIGMNIELPDVDRTDARQRAKAYCKVLVLFMTPVFHDERSVAQEAKRRHDARKSGDVYQTPGMKHGIYKTLTDGEAWYPSTNGAWTNDPSLAAGEPRMTDDAILNRVRGHVDGDVRNASGVESRSHLAKGPARNLPSQGGKAVSAAESAAIKGAVASGMFSEEDLAVMYKIPVDQVRSIVAG